MDEERDYDATSDTTESKGKGGSSSKGLSKKLVGLGAAAATAVLLGVGVWAIVNQVDIGNKNASLGVKDKTITEQKDQLSKNDNTIKDQDKTIDEQGKTIEDQKGQIDEQGKTIEDQKGQIAEKDKTIQDKDKELAGKDDIIEEKDREIEQLKGVTFNVEFSDNDAKAVGQKYLGNIIGEIKSYDSLNYDGENITLFFNGLNEDGKPAVFAISLRSVAGIKEITANEINSWLSNQSKDVNPANWPKAFIFTEIENYNFSQNDLASVQAISKALNTANSLEDTVGSEELPDTLTLTVDKTLFSIETSAPVGGIRNTTLKALSKDEDGKWVIEENSQWSVARSDNNQEAANFKAYEKYAKSKGVELHKDEELEA